MEEFTAEALSFLSGYKSKVFVYDEKLQLKKGDYIVINWRCLNQLKNWYGRPPPKITQELPKDWKVTEFTPLIRPSFKQIITTMKFKYTADTQNKVEIYQ